MTLEEAKNYIYYAYKEGYLDEREMERLESLPEEEMVKEVEEMAARGDTEIDRLSEED